MTRRRRRGPPGWARAKNVLARMLHSKGVARPADKIGRTRFLGEGVSYLTYVAGCELPDDAGKTEELTLVVRLPRYECADHLVEVVAREERILEYLNTLSLPLQLPRPIATVPADPGMASVQSAVAGLPLVFKEKNAIEVVAEVASIVHGVDPNPLLDVVPHHSDRQAHARAALEMFSDLEIPEARDALAWAEQHLPPPTPPRFLHGDLMGQNILRPWDPEETPLPGLIDWVYARVGDPAYDLAIATRGVRRPFNRSGGLQTLVDRYNAKARDQLTVAEVRLHELFLVAGFYRATAEEHGPNSPAAEHEQRRLRGLLRRCSA